MVSSVADGIEDRGDEVARVSTSEAAEAAVRDPSVELMVTDLPMPGNGWHRVARGRDAMSENTHGVPSPRGGGRRAGQVVVAESGRSGRALPDRRLGGRRDLRDGLPRGLQLLYRSAFSRGDVLEVFHRLPGVAKVILRAGGGFLAGIIARMPARSRGMGSAMSWTPSSSEDGASRSARRAGRRSARAARSRRATRVGREGPLILSGGSLGSAVASLAGRSARPARALDRAPRRCFRRACAAIPSTPQSFDVPGSTGRSPSADTARGAEHPRLRATHGREWRTRPGTRRRRQTCAACSACCRISFENIAANWSRAAQSVYS